VATLVCHLQANLLYENVKT